jgi:hypothetical protein
MVIIPDIRTGTVLPMRLFLIVVFCFLVLFWPSTVSPWVKSYGGEMYEEALDIQRTSDGGYVVAGWARSFGGGGAWVLKVNADGQVNWENIYGEHAYKFTAIRPTPDGGYILAGSNVPSNPPPYWEALVLKIQADGEVDWRRTYSREGYYEEGPLSIEATADGGYIVAGYAARTLDFYNVRMDAWVLKLDDDGDIMWQKVFGEDLIDQFYAVQQTFDGGYIAAGYTHSYSEQPFHSDGWVLKLNANGDVEWQKAYGGERGDRFMSIQQSSDGGYLVAGRTSSFGAVLSDFGLLGIDCWVLKLENNGDVTWQKTYGGGSGESAYSVKETSDGDFIVAGESSSFGAGTRDGWLLKLRYNGEIRWQKTYGGEEWDCINDIEETPDGYAATGWTKSFGAGRWDVWILTLSPSGGLGSLCTIDASSDAVPHDSDADVRNIEVSSVDAPLSPSPSADVVTESAAEISTCSNVVFSVPDVDRLYERRFYLCIDWPGGVGVGRPRRCPPALDLCLECSYFLSKYAEMIPIPDYLRGIYHEVPFVAGPPVVLGGSKGKDPLGRLKKLIEKAPIGAFFDERMKTDLMNELRGSKDLKLGKLAKAVNAMELDQSVPSLPASKVRAGRYSAADLNGVAWLVFHDVEKNGEVTLRIRNELPASPQGFAPGWPIASYEFEFSGAFSEGGYIDLSFFIGGMNFGEMPSPLRVFEWDGKSLKDVTTNLDLRRGVISGRSNKLATYIVMRPDSGTDQPGWSQAVDQRFK